MADKANDNCLTFTFRKFLRLYLFLAKVVFTCNEFMLLEIKQMFLWWEYNWNDGHLKSKHIKYGYLNRLPSIIKKRIFLQVLIIYIGQPKEKPTRILPVIRSKFTDTRRWSIYFEKKNYTKHRYDIVRIQDAVSLTYFACNKSRILNLSNLFFFIWDYHRTPCYFFPCRWILFED